MEEALEGASTGVWEENLLAVGVFVAMSTQWRLAGHGATGLDYGVLPVVPVYARLTVEKQSEVFDDMRVLEDEALATMRRFRDG